MSERALEFAVDEVDATFVVRSANVEEALGEPFVASVLAVAHEGGSPVPSVPLDLVGRRARLTLRFQGTTRTFSGFVEDTEDREDASGIRIVHPIGWLRDTRDYRVFVDESAKAIVGTVLGEHGLSVDFRAEREPPSRKQTVQSFESDFDFVRRLLAEEGLSFFLPTDDPTKVCVADKRSAFIDAGLSLPYREEGGLDLRASVYGGRRAESIRAERVVLRDYDFTHPQLDLQAEDGQGALECYEYPGDFDDAAVGRELASLRLASLRDGDSRFEGAASSPELAAGVVLTVSDAPMASMGQAWLLERVSHRAQLTPSGEPAYEARFAALPAERGHRLSRERVVERAAPRRAGLTTAIVAGASGSELHMDEYGAARARLRWERRRSLDDSASTDLRVMQPALSGGVLHPRVGWEELVAHRDPSGEAPVLLGRLYNGAQCPPANAKTARMQTHLGTLTTPAGSGGNQLLIDDSAGKEKLLRKASRDFNERTEKDKVRKVGANEKRTIGGKRKQVVKERRVVRVDGAHSLSVAALRTLKVNSNFTLNAADELIVVGGARIFRVAGDSNTITPQLIRVVAGAKGELCVEHHSITTVGASALLIRGNQTTNGGLSEGITVGGAALTHVAGAMNVTAAQDYKREVRGVLLERAASRTATSGGDTTEKYATLLWKAGPANFTAPEIAIEAAMEIIIKAGGVTVRLTPSSLIIDGNFVGVPGSSESGEHRYG